MITYGTNLIENGTFNSSLTPWVAGIQWSVDTGRAKGIANFAFPYASIRYALDSLVTDGNSRYRIEFDYSGEADAGGTFDLYLGNDSEPVSVGTTTIESSVKRFSAIVTPVGDYKSFAFVLNIDDTATSTVYLDNVSIQEVLSTVSFATRSKGFYGSNHGFYRK